MTQEIEKHLKNVVGYSDSQEYTFQYKEKEEYNRLKNVLAGYPSSLHGKILDFYQKYNNLVLKYDSEVTLKTLEKVRKKLNEASNHYAGNDISSDGAYYRIRYTQTKGKGLKNRYIPFPINQPKSHNNITELILFFIKSMFIMYLEREPEKRATQRLHYIKELCKLETLNRFVLSEVIEFANKENISPKKFIRDIFQVEI